MKLASFFLVAWSLTNIRGLDEPVLKVSKTASDNQIKEIERQVFQQFGIKAAVKVMNRNSNGEITNLKYVRFDKAGKEAGSCSSDRFGLLIITRNGCKIADLGYENQI